MKVLYAIQGTGNGHFSRALELLPYLKERVQVDVLVSGMQADLKLPFDIKYKYKGLSFYFGKNGSINYFKTFADLSVFKTIQDIRKCPVEQYDLVINDFEPISAWACRLKGVTCYSVSHQSALVSKATPRPDYKDWKFEFILKHYAPGNKRFGFHFKRYDKSHYLPIIRKKFRELETSKQDHYTVYLPAYSDKKMIKILSQIPNTTWHVFSKHTQKSYVEKNVHIKTISIEGFENSIASCQGVMCGAGFETPSEALYLKKKLLVIPMKGQYEQQSNAVCLKEMGVTVLKKLSKKKIKAITKWTKKDSIVQVNYPDNAPKVVDDILLSFVQEHSKKISVEKELQLSNS